jgi:two-component system, NarL family, sensor histidine kinase LiaS
MWLLKSSQWILKNSTSDTSERLRIARDLHDSLAQEISALGYFCDSAIALSVMGQERQALVDIRARLSRLGISLRDEIALLRDDQRSFSTLLEQLLEEVQKEHPLTVTATFATPIFIDDSKTIGLFRVVKEVILNILAHSSARSMAVELRQDSHSMELRITDDGISYLDSDASKIDAHHFGRRGVVERMELLGGTIGFTREDGANICRITL